MGLRLSLLQGIAVALSVVFRKHLKIVLEEVGLYSAVLTDKDSPPILKLMKVIPFPEGPAHLPHRVFQGIRITPASHFSEALRCTIRASLSL